MPIPLAVVTHDTKTVRARAIGVRHREDLVQDVAVKQLRSVLRLWLGSAAEPAHVLKHDEVALLAAANEGGGERLRAEAQPPVPRPNAVQLGHRQPDVSSVLAAPECLQHGMQERAPVAETPQLSLDEELPYERETIASVSRGHRHSVRPLPLAFRLRQDADLLVHDVPSQGAACGSHPQHRQAPVARVVPRNHRRRVLLARSKRGLGDEHSVPIVQRDGWVHLTGELVVLLNEHVLQADIRAKLRYFEGRDFAQLLVITATGFPGHRPTSSTPCKWLRTCAPSVAGCSSVALLDIAGPSSIVLGSSPLSRGARPSVRTANTTSLIPRSATSFAAGLGG
mmetsp:Transcript_65915/g.183632  ORF Transcript_65915/g.183632 Transcript_65915/m.183632 type:complete len:339 (+) Transcript_65915:850-1866(+)